MSSNADHNGSLVTKPRGRGGRPRRPGVTDSILDATIELAAEGGLEDLTLDAIAARAGVGRPTIYRRWPSKDALLAEAIEMIAEKYGVFPHSGNVRDDLVEWARLAIQNMQSPLRSVWLAYFNVDEAHFAEEAVKRARDRNVDIVRRGVERGELRSDANPELLAEMVFSTIWYQVTLRHRRLEPEFAETVVDTVLNSWWAGDAPAARRRSTRQSAAPQRKPRAKLTR
jgi:AcrR family transcriptional regulator